MHTRSMHPHGNSITLRRCQAHRLCFVLSGFFHLELDEMEIGILIEGVRVVELIPSLLYIAQSQSSRSQITNLSITNQLITN